MKNPGEKETDLGVELKIEGRKIGKEEEIRLILKGYRSKVIKTYGKKRIGEN